jgi:hypothetical protein
MRMAMPAPSISDPLTVISRVPTVSVVQINRERDNAAHWKRRKGQCHLLVPVLHVAYPKHAVGARHQFARLEHFDASTIVRDVKNQVGRRSRQINREVKWPRCTGSHVGDGKAILWRAVAKGDSHVGCG